MGRRWSRNWSRRRPWFIYPSVGLLLLILLPSFTTWWAKGEADAQSMVVGRVVGERLDGERGMELALATSLSQGVSTPLQWQLIIKTDTEQGEMVTLRRSKSGQVVSLPLEEYVAGVVAAEMPVSFPLEALKAQAIAARTYAVYHGGSSTQLSDQVLHQVYHDEEELRARWGAQYEENWAKIEEAVAATADQILVYQGKPILALYFSTSNGYTENAEEYWQQAFPYLRSVPSPWDANSPHATTTTLLAKEDVAKKLKLDLGDLIAVQTVSTSGRNPIYSLGTVVEWTTGKRVKRYELGGAEWSGRQLRELLQLKSAHFKLELVQDQIQVTTYGYGHGVGMSQWGAAGMAAEGYNNEAILLHYYQGAELASLK